MFSHIDSANRPSMVDVGDKAVTERKAHACALVVLPAVVADLFEQGDIASRKGPVFHTAILAGVMGVKRTADLIPLCHPLPLDNCRVEIKPRDHVPGRELIVEIHCHVRMHGRTGVEMEALTGATIAALTVYDMCKAVSHGIEISSVHLVSKTGGKADYLRV